jgi:hypothetical protein
MCGPMLANGGPIDMAGSLRHRRVPLRVLGDTLIVARPLDGAAVELPLTAALVWYQLDVWTTVAEIDDRLAEEFPEVTEEDRVAARIEILRQLRDEDLLERS